jgi:hypothetical protein
MLSQISRYASRPPYFYVFEAVHHQASPEQPGVVLSEVTGSVNTAPRHGEPDVARVGCCKEQPPANAQYPLELAQRGIYVTWQ